MPDTSTERPWTAEEVERCKAAMALPAPIKALADIASGAIVVSLTKDGRDCYVEDFNGRPWRDPEFPDRKGLLAGAWPLRRAGMIDDFGCVTEEGRRLLSRGLPQEEAS